MKIYTRTGDTGRTGLLDGSRVEKDHPRVCAGGSIDELSAVLGVAGALANDAAFEELLAEIQRHLFALGSRLADPSRVVVSGKGKVSLTGDHVRRLEEVIDELESELPPLKSFLLPGGCPAGALCHLARTVCRRAERALVGLAREQSLEPVVLEYVNRLSDLLFVLARQQNHAAGREELSW
jgi:cob(I)alamin adenosyltransferase